MVNTLTIISCLSILFSIYSARAQYRDTKYIPLKNGQCYADPNSKVYLKGLAGTSAKSISNEIELNKLSDTAETNYYFCKATCQINNSEYTLWVTQKDSPTNFSKMDGFICAGVRMENVPLVGSLTTIAPVIYPFWGFDSKLSEIESIFKKNKLRLSQEDKIDLNKKMNVVFLQMGQGYLSAASTPISAAGNILLFIGSEKAGYKKTLDYYLEILRKNNWEIQQDFSSADFYIMNAIKSYGRHLDY